MGTLGKYLSSARVAKGLDLHDASRQTRISIQYLKALEEEDFAKLPGSVFVKGFLKNYGKFLGLPETEVLQRYNEVMTGAVAVVPHVHPVEQKAVPQEQKRTSRVPLEPLLWGAAIIVSVILFLFMAIPEKPTVPERSPGAYIPPPTSELTGSVPVMKPEKLYLQVVALDDVWLLVRTDAGPQKKTVLKKGENVIWSADERFLVSYSNVGAVKLLLNGEELVVNAPKNAVVRDVAITAAGITVPKAAPVPPKQAKPKPRQEPKPQQPVQPPLPTQPQAQSAPSAPVAAPPPPMPVPQLFQVQPTE